MIKGFILIHLMEFFESHVDDEKIEELKKSDLPQASLLREALVYSNEYPIEMLQEYEKLIDYCQLNSEDYLSSCGKYLGDNIFDHFFYIHHGKGIYPLLESLSNLFPYIFGNWTFTYSVHNSSDGNLISLECEPTTELPDFFIRILKYTFRQLLLHTGVTIEDDVSVSRNNNIIIFQYKVIK